MSFKHKFRHRCHRSSGSSFSNWPSGSWSRPAYAFGYAGWYDSPERTADKTSRHEQEERYRDLKDSFYEHREHRDSRHGYRHKKRHGDFGVRRPLRYLSYQLDLDESQRRGVAAALDRVKTEREQAALDEKKMVADLADLVASPELSSESLSDTLAARVRATESVQNHVARAIKEIVGLLDPDQRQEFAYLLRTGAFRI
ncbi:MAG: hypothetical protein AAGE43_15955 [Pseudomonadota bacterium]